MLLTEEFKDDFVKFGQHGELKNLYQESSDAGGGKEVSQTALRTVTAERIFSGDLMSDIRISQDERRNKTHSDKYYTNMASLPLSLATLLIETGKANLILETRIDGTRPGAPEETELRIEETGSSSSLNELIESFSVEGESNKNGNTIHPQRTSSTERRKSDLGMSRKGTGSAIDETNSNMYELSEDYEEDEEEEDSKAGKEELKVEIQPSPRTLYGRKKPELRKSQSPDIAKHENVDERKEQKRPVVPQ